MRSFYIYRYIDKKTKDIVYIGKTARIAVRDRIKQHIDDPIGKWAQNNEHTIEFIELPKEEDMNYIESYLIRKYTPKFNIVFADNTKLPPFEIIINEDIWINLEKYISEEKERADKLNQLTKNNISNNIETLIQKFSN